MENYIVNLRIDLEKEDLKIRSLLIFQNMEWTNIYRDSKCNLIVEKMFGDFPESWKQRPCPMCWDIEQGINLENEYWGKCEHGYEKIVKKKTSNVNEKKEVKSIQSKKQRKEERRKEREKQHKRYNYMCEECKKCVGNPRCDYCGEDLAGDYCEYDFKTKLICCCPNRTDCMEKLNELYKDSGLVKMGCCCDKSYTIPGECNCYFRYR